MERALSEDEIELLFAAPLPSGCRYPETCNYDPVALVDDGSCELGLANAWRARFGAMIWAAVWLPTRQIPISTVVLE